jgi:DNA helicase-2/ATP-dependent DNA helicase PcrA
MPAEFPPPAPKRYVLRRAASSKSYRIDYHRELNPEQQAVVFAPDGPTVVVAGAGSGKTRTLVYRVSRLVEDGVAPEALLLLTFTNRAAKEMTRRVEGLLGADLARMTAGTFHSVGARLLRPHAELLGYRPNFSILDAEDTKDLLESATSDLGIPITERRFPKGDLLRAIVSFAANTGQKVDTVIGHDYPHLLAQLEPVKAVIRRYLERKVLANAMDYDDLLLNWKRLLETHPEVRRALGTRFLSVLVDEFQDVNHLQSEIVDLLALDSEPKNVMVVGDDAQSIYSFRGADAEALLGFPDRYPGAAIYRLETNYRSTPEILRLADASIAHNSRRYEKTLVATREPGVPVVVVGARDLAQQAEFVAQRVLELRDEGTPLSEIGVLYRAHFQALELQIELTRRGIPYEVRSGLRFFEQAHVKDVLAHLRLLVNPKDEMSFKRALKLLPKVGERTAAVLWEAVSEAPEPLAAFLALELGKAPSGARAGLLRFRETMKTLRKPSYFSSPAEAIRYVVDDGGYGDVAKGKFPNHSARLDDLEALAQFALAYDDVGRFLEEVTLFGDPVGEDQVAGEEDDERLVLSSVHQAKGLEWKAVFVIGLQEDRFPNLRAARTPEGLEEERRLFYVAATRAKDELLLVHPLSAFDRYGIVVVTEPSRFLRELPETLYERWVLDETVDASLGSSLAPGPDRPRLAADPTLDPDDDDSVN